MNKHTTLAALAFLLITSSCKTLFNGDEEKPDMVVNLDTIEVVDQVNKRMEYNPSETRVIDLIHTKLDVSFEWENQYLNGEAVLDIQPYFHPVYKVDLDAKSFDIHAVTLNDSRLDTLDFEYNGEILSITLDKEYTRADTFSLFIDYTAKPEEREAGGSAAIMSDKGLYFINPNNTENKPQQIWTQGETEASSCWFPTVDAPNERMTQELSITVRNEFKTLSNGNLDFSTENGDGTRTDYWSQRDPHAPYLVMMAVGDFAVVNDSWRDSLNVDYYVEKEFEDHAMAIFGETPEMIEFYSNLLDYDYPWEKYAQVVVRDYVSGAMENTTAVIHGEFLHRTKQQLIDAHNEDIIAHELFHHWFGDLVTCESWANLPLNESFATYGEYLWNEHKHGSFYADEKLAADLSNYLSEFSRGKAVDLVRFNYDDKEDMFDAHSYQKGGRILHMLRKYLGDEAFFASLSKYLKDNAYTAVEMHNFRLACEEVSGEDLNWFFNQWFFDKGHPDLHITYSYNDSLNVQSVTIEQRQDTEEFPVYKLPMKVDLYTKQGVRRQTIVLDSIKKTFDFKISQKPLLVNVDAEKMLLATKTDDKPLDQYFYQLENAPLYIDKLEAFNVLKNRVLADSLAAEAVFSLFNHDFEGLRVRSVGTTLKLKKFIGDRLETRLIELAKTDKNSEVRATALQALAENYHSESYENLYIQKLKEDSSLMVMSEALSQLAEINPSRALKEARALEKLKDPTILVSISAIYANVGTDENASFYSKSMKEISGFSKMAFMANYADYLTQERKLKTIQSALPALEEELKTPSGMWFISFGSARAFKNVYDHYNQEMVQLEEQITKSESEEGGKADPVVQDRYMRLKGLLDDMDGVIERVKSTEGINERVKRVL